MAHDNEDDKPTVVLDLIKLRKEQESKEASLAKIAAEIEFNVIDSKSPAAESPKKTAQKLAILFYDFNNDFFSNAKQHFPMGSDSKICSALNELSAHLKSQKFQLVVFLYDQNPKGVNQLSAQIKQKFPQTKVIIVAKNISPEKAKLHAATPAGAHGYLALPLEVSKVQQQLDKIFKQEKKAG